MPACKKSGPASSERTNSFLCFTNRMLNCAFFSARPKTATYEKNDSGLNFKSSYYFFSIFFADPTKETDVGFSFDFHLIQKGCIPLIFEILRDQCNLKSPRYRLNAITWYLLIIALITIFTFFLIVEDIHLYI